MGKSNRKQDVVDAALKTAGLRVMVVCPREAVCRDRFEEFVELLGTAVEQEVRASGLLRIRLTNGSVVYFRSASAHPALRGMSLDLIYAETKLSPDMQHDAEVSILASGGKIVS